MTLLYYKHHDDDRWYWLLVSLNGIALEAGDAAGYRTQVECLTAMLPVIEANPDATVMYRAKPGN